MKSKYIGMKFDEWRVVEGFVKNKYKKSYNNGKVREHRSMSFILVNEIDGATITLSGNTLRLLNNGCRTMRQILNPIMPSSTNKELKAYIKQKENILEFNENILSKLTKLDKNKVYLFNIDMKDAPIETAYKFTRKLKEACEDLGIAGIYSPIIDGRYAITVTELNKYIKDKK